MKLFNVIILYYVVCNVLQWNLTYVYRFLFSNFSHYVNRFSMPGERSHNNLWYRWVSMQRGGGGGEL